MRDLAKCILFRLEPVMLGFLLTTGCAGCGGDTTNHGSRIEAFEKPLFLDETDPCQGIDCGGHGTCYSEQDQAFCLCDEGFSAESVRCIRIPGQPQASFSDFVYGPGDDIVAIAVAEDGRGPEDVGKEINEYPYDLGRYLSDGEWWCSEFVSWVYKVAGLPFSGGSQGGWMLRGNTGVRSWFQKKSLWIGRDDPDWASFVPAPGDFMRLDTSGGGHSAIVRKISGTTLYTVEGNVSDRVVLRTYSNYKNNTKIDGFGMRGPPDNQPPEVAAGESQSVLLPNPAFLKGQASDDGYPNQTLSPSWEMRDGPSPVTFEDASALETKVSFSQAGHYTLRLTVSDGDLQASAELQVEVLSNEAPVIDAGKDISILVGESVTLQAQAEDDGLPEDQLTFTWTQATGPGQASFDDASILRPTVTFVQSGPYTLHLTVNDGDLATQDEVQIQVSSPEVEIGAMLGCQTSSAPAFFGWMLLLYAVLAFRRFW